ncbi:hypothetical protein [Pseudomonas farris]
MKRELFAKDIDKKIDLFHRAFDRDDDLLTAVLRGHMMVEERLHDVISAGVASYSRPYDKNDIFTFGTATNLAKAIVGSASGSELWKAIKSLNNLRNAVGHRYEPVRLDNLLVKFFKDSELTAHSIFRKNFTPYNPEGEDEETHAIVVRTRSMALWTVLGIHADNLARDLDSALKSRRES